MKKLEIAVLIPCYNEAVTIYNVVKDFHHHLPTAAIYVGDNNSTDIRLLRPKRQEPLSFKNLIRIKKTSYIAYFAKCRRIYI